MSGSRTVQATRYVCPCKGLLLVDHEGRRVLHSRPSAGCTTSGCARFENLIRTAGGPTFDALRTLMMGEGERQDVDATLFEAHSAEWRAAPPSGSRASERDPNAKDVLECRECDTQIAFCPGCGARAVDVFRPQRALGLALLERIRPILIDEGEATPPETLALWASKLQNSALNRLGGAWPKNDRAELQRAKAELEDATANILALLHQIHEKLATDG